MPVTIWDEAAFNQFYRLYDLSTGQIVPGYSRRILVDQYHESGRQTMFDRRRDALISNFGIQPSDRVLIVGAAFGFLIEAFRDSGYLNVWGIDNSPYVSAQKGIEMRGDVVVVEDDVRGGGRVKAAFRSATGDDVFTWVITDDVATCYADADVVQLAPVLETLLENGLPASNVVHVVSVGGPDVIMDSAITNHTLEEWKTLVPAHSWMSVRGEV